MMQKRPGVRKESINQSIHPTTFHHINQSSERTINQLNPPVHATSINQSINQWKNLFYPAFKFHDCKRYKNGKPLKSYSSSAARCGRRRIIRRPGQIRRRCSRRFFPLPFRSLSALRCCRSGLMALGFLRFHRGHQWHIGSERKLTILYTEQQHVYQWIK